MLAASLRLRGGLVNNPAARGVGRLGDDVVTGRTFLPVVILIEFPIAIAVNMARITEGRLYGVIFTAFCESMRRVHDHSSIKARTMRVTTGRTMVDVDISGLRYIEVYGHKTILHTSKGEIAVGQSLSALEEALGGDPFLRCYRYFIVNMDFVKRVTKDTFLMKDGREIPLSRDGRAAIKNRYLSYVFKRMEG